MISFNLSSQTLRTTLASAVLAVGIHLAQSQDVLTDFTRPLVIAALHALGVSAVDAGEMIAIGRLEVPWTRDCAGVNLLLILLALTVWVNRQEKSLSRFWLRVAFTLPAALAANIARVLTLICYRTVFYPAVESPQTHYFMGLIWLVPFVTCILPKEGRPLYLSWMETLHAAAVVALLAPLAGTPNGSLVIVCAVVALAHCRMRQDHGGLRAGLTALWLACGAGIATINMESFWLPWLLLCPLLLDLGWLRRLSAIPVLLCAHPMIAMHSWAIVLGGIGLALTFAPALTVKGPGVSGTRRTGDSPSSKDVSFLPSTSGSGLWLKALRLACLVGFACPFTASTLLAFGFEKWTPPATVESRFIGNEGYEIRLPDQPAQVGMVCFASPSRDRHHTVKVCLKYRGVEIKSIAGDSAVFTDGTHWLREFFIQDDTLHTSYAGYLHSTFRPWADPGVHLIFVGPADQMSAVEFESCATRLAEQFHAQCPSPLRSAAPSNLALQP